MHGAIQCQAQAVRACTRVYTCSRVPFNSTQFNISIVNVQSVVSSQPAPHVPSRPNTRETSAALTPVRVVHLAALFAMAFAAPAPAPSLLRRPRFPQTPPKCKHAPSPLRMAAPAEILHLTDHWVAVNKPPDMLVHRTRLHRSSRPEPYLVDLVRRTLRARLSSTVQVFPVHRLDRPTSGLILFALRDPALLQAALQAPSARKQYWTLSFGLSSMPPGPWENAHPLKDLTGSARKQRSAHTAFEPLASFPAADVAAVRATLSSTGRRHQIRRHLSYARYPVVGDTSHGDSALNRGAADAFGVSRCCLHARRITFVDPVTARDVHLEVPVPPDLRAVVCKLPGYAPHMDEALDLGDPLPTLEGAAVWDGDALSSDVDDSPDGAGT